MHLIAKTAQFRISVDLSLQSVDFPLRSNGKEGGYMFKIPPCRKSDLNGPIFESQSV
jgi:hypothetical protein